MAEKIIPQKRMTDERIAEIEKRRLRTPTGFMPDGKTLPPLPADTELSEELFQGIKTERVKTRNEGDQAIIDSLRKRIEQLESERLEIEAWHKFYAPALRADGYLKAVNELSAFLNKGEG